MVRNFFDPSIFKQILPKQGMSTAPAFDVKQIMDTQRRNMQAVNDVVRLGFESLQQALTQQTELLSRMVHDNSSYASSIMHEGTPEQKVQRQAELVRKSYEDSVSGAREVGDILTKASEEASEIINRRVTASLAEIKAALEHNIADSSDADSSKEKSAAKKPASKSKNAA